MAIVLFFLGSGPVQGFAVTLGLGILTSLFTAYTVTLWEVAVWYKYRRPKKLKIQVFRFLPDGTKIPFMKLARYVIIFSLIMTCVSIGSAVFKGFNLGIDFKGGSAIEVQSTVGPADPGCPVAPASRLTFIHIFCKVPLGGPEFDEIVSIQPYPS